MKRIILTMKRISILLVLISCTTFTLAQQPNITVKKMINDTYQDIGKNEHILAGQKDTFQIKISEPDDGGEDFFSHDGQLKVFLPDSVGLNLNAAAFAYEGNQSDISFENDSLSTNKDTLFTDVNVTNNEPLKQDKIIITDLIIEFPDDLADGDDFELRAWADFMDTDDDGAADTTEFELVNFKYTKPLLSITKQSTACYGEKVVCDLDITPAGLAYELVGSLNNGKMVKDGDELEFEYNDVVHLLDTG